LRRFSESEKGRLGEEKGANTEGRWKIYRESTNKKKQGRRMKRKLKYREGSERGGVNYPKNGVKRASYSGALGKDRPARKERLQKFVKRGKRKNKEN